jgi:hypothetical protein
MWKMDSTDGNVNLIDLGNTIEGMLALGMFLLIVFLLYKSWRDDKDKKNREREG